MSNNQKAATSAVAGIQPLSYLNQNQPATVLGEVSTRNPRNIDRRYKIGTIWINKNSNECWCLTSVINNIANWEPIGTTGSAPITKYVVDADGTGDYTTIQSAIDAANIAATPATIYIRPGTYTENLTFYDGIDLYGSTAVSQNQGSSVTIIGTHTPPTSGHIGFNSIYFQDTTAIFSSAAAGTTHIVLLNCESAVQNGYFFDLVNWTGIFEIGDHNPSAAGAPFAVDDGGINNTGGATLFMFSSGFGSGTTNTMNLSGTIIIGEGDISSPVDFGTGSDLDIAVIQYGQPVTFSGNCTAQITYGQFTGGANPAITMSSTANVTISNAVIDSSNNPAIAGAGIGILTVSSLSFLNNSNIAGTLTLSNVSRSATGGIKIVEGTNATSGVATLVAGTVTVNTTAVNANSRIHLTPQSVLAGTVYISAVVAGTSFTITSTNGADVPNVAWLIVDKV